MRVNNPFQPLNVREEEEAISVTADPAAAQKATAPLQYEEGNNFPTL